MGAPALTILVLALLVLISFHLYWRARFQRAQETLQREIQKEIKKLQQAQEQIALQVQTQQEALFNSLAEGLLLLDRSQRIQLANPAFNELFAVTTDIRSRTIMEALRLHELADLVEALGTREQVVDYELKLFPPN